MFTRAMAIEASEEAEAAQQSYASHTGANPSKQRKLVDYYALLDVPRSAGEDHIREAYLAKIDEADEGDWERLERAVDVLTNIKKRQAYDQRLNENQTAQAAPAEDERGDSYTPPRQRKPDTAAIMAAASRTATQERSTVRLSTEETRQDGAQGQGPLTGRSAGRGNSASASQARGSQERSISTSVKGGQARGANQKQADQAGRNSKQGTARQGRINGQRDGQAVREQPVRYTRTQQQSTLSISWVGGLAILVILGALGWWAVTSINGGGAGPIDPGTQSQLEADLGTQAIVAPIAADGKQTLDLVVDGDTMSYEPKGIKVKQGVPVRFNLSVKGRDPG